jgi:hypothetical protein
MGQETGRPATIGKQLNAWQWDGTEHLHILFILALRCGRCSLPVTLKYQSAYSSWRTQLAGFAVPMPSKAARCRGRISSSTSAGRRLADDVNLSLIQGQNNKQVHIHTTKQKSTDRGIKSKLSMYKELPCFALLSCGRFHVCSMGDGDRRRMVAMMGTTMCSIAPVT